MIKNSKVTGKLFLMLLPLIVMVLVCIGYYSFRQISIFNETRELYGDIVLTVQSEIQNSQLEFYQAIDAEREMNYSTYMTKITRDNLCNEYHTKIDSVGERIARIEEIVSKDKELYVGTSTEESGGTFEDNLKGFNTIYNEWNRMYDPSTGKGSYQAQQNRFSLVEIYLEDMNIIMQAYSEKRMDELEKQIFSEIVVVAILALIIVFVGIIISVIVAKYIKSSIDAVTSSTERLSNNDLSFDMNASNTKDEFGQMSRATAKLVQEFKNIVRTLSNSSTKLSESEQDLNSITTKATQSVSQITRAISEMATTANQQAVDTESISQNIVDLSVVMEESTASAKSLNNASILINNETQEGMELVNELLKITEKNQEAFDEVFNVLKDISNSTREIGAASTLISDIASRTNLLSLNASIEAARAGEAGKGFAVVAEEIRDLAEQSKNSAETIDQLLAVLSFNSEKADSQSEIVKECVKTQTDSVYTTMNKYKTIVESISTINSEIEVLEGVNTKLDIGFKNISELITSLSAASEENAAVADELAQQADNVLNNVNGIGTSSENVHDLADGLKDIVGMFNLGENDIDAEEAVDSEIEEDTLSEEEVADYEQADAVEEATEDDFWGTPASEEESLAEGEEVTEEATDEF